MEKQTENQIEIERKFLVNRALLPFSPANYPSTDLEQGYLCTDPTVRIRREGDAFVLTYKSKGLLERQEYNLPLTEEGYRHLLGKVDGHIIRKTRYRIPLPGGLTAELDLFSGPLSPLAYVEVEFSSTAQALAFTPPDWFGREVTGDPSYTNSALISGHIPDGSLTDGK